MSCCLKVFEAPASSSTNAPAITKPSAAAAAAAAAAAKAIKKLKEAAKRTAAPIAPAANERAKVSK